MKKQKPSKHQDRAQTDSPAGDDPGWKPLFSAAREVIEWALDIAARLSRNDREDLRSIERVREFARAWLEGRRGEVPLTDLLVTVGIIFAAIELDTKIDSVDLLTPMRTFVDTPAMLPPILRLPGVPRTERPTVVVRRVPARRNAPAFPFQLAA